MELFDFEDLDNDFHGNDLLEERIFKSKDLKRKNQLVTRNQNAHDVIPAIKKGEQHAVVSVENFGSIELLDVLTSRQFAKEIFITTWSINADFIDLIKKLLLQGTRVNFYCDKSLRTRKQVYWAQVAELHFQNKQTFKVKLMDALHAKITIIDFGEDKITIEGSANYSKNTRVEQFILTNDTERYEFHRGWIKEL